MKKRKSVKVSEGTRWRIVLLLALLIAALVWVSRTCALKPAPAAGASADLLSPINVPGRLELPRIDDSTFVVDHPEGRYTLLYDTAYRQAAWVAYVLTRAEVERKGTERSDRFVPDPEVTGNGWPTAVTGDYARSGYDRGHLLPSADRDDTPRENRATFLLSNVSPQLPAVNRGVWKRLEEQVRRWARDYDSLYVVTGSVPESGLPRLKGGVGIPSAFFKALLVCRDGGWYAVAFLVPNRADVESDYTVYRISVDSLEERTDYDFFPALPDEVETEAERVVEGSVWR